MKLHVVTLSANPEGEMVCEVFCEEVKSTKTQFRTINLLSTSLLGKAVYYKDQQYRVLTNGTKGLIAFGLDQEKLMSDCSMMFRGSSSVSDKQQPETNISAETALRIYLRSKVLDMLKDTFQTAENAITEDMVNKCVETALESNTLLNHESLKYEINRVLSASGVGFPADGDVTIYTDGACLGNPGAGGWAAILQCGNVVKELSGNDPATTNNRMELLGVINALNYLSGRRRVTVYSDSKYVVDAITKGWAKGWKYRGWYKADGNKAKNADLWETLLALTSQHEVTFCWVKGHAGNPLNERCDLLATDEAKKVFKPI